MKLCTCGRPATHYVALVDQKTGEPNGKKKLMCDGFPNCRPVPRHHKD
ncbi:MAG TPA: hypothetical protein VIM11_26815 [Tepidisphaeraceae bacterium]|jgi:hypothetical protein